MPLAVPHSLLQLAWQGRLQALAQCQALAEEAEEEESGHIQEESYWVTWGLQDASVSEVWQCRAATCGTGLCASERLRCVRRCV